MSDYRDPDFRDPRNRDLRDPPLPSDLQAERESNAMWGWIVGGVFLLLVIGFAIGIGRNDTQVASTNPPATTTTPKANPPAGSPANPSATTPAPTPSPAAPRQ
jgi:hypothetical protein